MRLVSSAADKDNEAYEVAVSTAQIFFICIYLLIVGISSCEHSLLAEVSAAIWQEVCSMWDFGKQILGGKKKILCSLTVTSGAISGIISCIYYLKVQEICSVLNYTKFTQNFTQNFRQIPSF